MYIRLKFANFTTFIVVVFFLYLVYLIWRTKEHFPDVVIELHDLLSYVLLAAELGGRAVVDTNDEQKFSVFKKTETNVGKAELLTKADLLSNQLIIGVLQRYPGLKVTVGIVEDQVISEEKKEKLSAVDYEKYQSQQEELYGNVKNIIDLFPSRKYSLSKLTVWVDPLDATQEFTEGLLEYVSVMICIALDSAPIFGVIYRPFSGERMYGLNEFGIVKGNGDKWDATFLKNTSKLIVVSRSHAGKVKELALKAFHANFTIEAAGGSGYKSLRLLNGTAELYMHKTAIKKWDTCAGDALLRSIGGSMLDFKGDELNYDPDDDYVLRNGLLAAAQYPFTYFQQLRQHLKDVLI